MREFKDVKISDRKVRCGKKLILCTYKHEGVIAVIAAPSKSQLKLAWEKLTGSKFNPRIFDKAIAVEDK